MLLTASAHAQQDAPAGAVSPSYAALADLLDNEQTRKQLIAQLRALANAPPPAAPAAETAPATAAAPTQPPLAADPAALSRGIADNTQHFAERLSAELATAAATFRALGRGEGVRGVSMAQWLSVLLGFAIVVAVTLAAWLILRAVAAKWFSRLDSWVARGDDGAASVAFAMPGLGEFSAAALYRKSGGIIAALVVDIATIGLAALIGYAVAWFGLGGRGAIGISASLFINAFIAVEIAKALARLVFATRYRRLRLLTMPDDVAIYWNRWLARLIGITGYGILVVVPIVKEVFTAAVGQMFGLNIMLGVYIYAVRVIWSNRVLLHDRLVRRAEYASTAVFGTLIRMLARVWHVLAIGYFTVLLVVSQIAPQEALPFMAKATLQTLIAMGVGLLLAAMLSALLSRRIRLSDELRSRLPMLEARFYSYVPAALKSLRMLILFAVVLVVLDAWRAFNLSAWIASGSGRATIAMIVHVAIILLIAASIWTVIASVIEHRLSATSGHGMPSEREKTLLALFRNAALVVIVTMTILVVLSQIGINIGPLIAGAGVVGLAIGFGAQKLVQDVITGIFIQLENGMNQNDVVEVGGVFGTVEKITIRSVGIRTLDGGYHLIPFSSVDKLANHMRDFAYHYGEYNIAHRADVDDAIHHLQCAFEELMQDAELAPAVLEKISIPGVTSLSERGFTIRVLIKTLPGMQWMIQRGFNRLVKKHFNAAGIELPYPHTVVHFEQEENGAGQ
jgi:small-conductance mechanosensitive channel